MKRLIFLILIALLLAAGVSIGRAQTGGGYDLTWNSINGGVIFSAGGAYSLSGTIGQADAGAMSGGSYTLVGGFWGVSGPALHYVFLPLIMK